eukprot:gene3508-6978_t
MLILIIQIYGDEYEGHKIPLKEKSAFKESFTCQQTGDNYSSRCTFKNAIVFKGDVYIISEKIISIPNILCSVADSLLAIMCKFKIKTKHEMLETLQVLNLTTIYGIRTESALYFGPLNGENIYHSLFEEMIPIYEILKYDSILSNWLDENNNNSIKLLHSESFHQTTISQTIYKIFFPHIDHSFKFTNSNQDNSNKNVYLVNYLVAGSNYSCVHYLHCSRSDFITPCIAGEFRDYILDKSFTSTSTSTSTSHRVVIT